ncbi:MAG: HlyD family efflux transporter periplasmic adaptor subunit [Flavobacteriales bacterium]|nr:HlyD family efflux transporter periplasmic adaptor subunit [Flavobacteriales bacterium]
MSISSALKARRSIFVGIVVILASMMVFRKLGRMGQSKPVISSFKQFNVLTSNAKVEDIPIKITLSGKLVARNRIDLFAEVNGLLISPDYREGNAYRKGDVLLRIDDSELRNSVVSSKSTLLNSVSQILPDLQLDFPDAYSQWLRFHKEISFRSVLPDIPEVSDEKLKVFLSSRNIFSSYYAIKSQEARLAKFNISAPFTGVLSSTDIYPGALVRAGQKLGTFIEPGSYELEASAGMDDLRYVNVGDKVVLRSNEMSGSWKGVVLRINRSLDQATQTVKVYIGVQGQELREGQYMVAEVDGVTLEDVCSIPRLILLPDEHIYVIANDSVLTRKKLDIVYRGMENVYAKNLQPGEVYADQVISNGHEGMIVHPIPNQND